MLQNARFITKYKNENKKIIKSHGPAFFTSSWTLNGCHKYITTAEQ